MLECMEILSIASDAGNRVYAVKGSWRLNETIQSKIIAISAPSRLTVLRASPRFVHREHRVIQGTEPRCTLPGC